MISAGDFRNGITIELEGNIYQIIEFQHVKPGKGAAFVRTKLKNIKISSQEQFWKDLSVLQRNSHRHVLTEKIISICMQMVIYSTLWMLRHMTRSLYPKTISVMP